MKIQDFLKTEMPDNIPKVQPQILDNEIWSLSKELKKC